MAATRGLPGRPPVPAGPPAPWWLALANGTEANFITEDLFLGAVAASLDAPAMKERGITHILVCHPDLPKHHPRHFCYERLPIVDETSANLLELLPQGLEFLCKAREKGGKTFVLCAKGISRSGSVAVALLMFSKGLGFEEALQVVQRRRPIAFPNVGFRTQLKRFEAILAQAGSAEAPWRERLERVCALVPRGPLAPPDSPFLVAEAIAAEMHAALDEVGKLAESGSGQESVWRRLGLFFEGVHKYGALPSDRALVRRARATAGVLRRMREPPQGSGRPLRGWPLALAQELERWAQWAEPRLGQVAPLAAGDYASGDEEEEAVDAVPEPAYPPAAPALVLGGEYDSSSDEEAAKTQPRGTKRTLEEQAP